MRYFIRTIFLVAILPFFFLLHSCDSLDPTPDMGSTTFDLDGQEINFYNNGYTLDNDIVSLLFTDPNDSSFLSIGPFILPENFPATLSDVNAIYVSSSIASTGSGDLKMTSFSNELMAGTFSSINLISIGVDPNTYEPLSDTIIISNGTFQNIPVAQ